MNAFLIISLIISIILLSVCVIHRVKRSVYIRNILSEYPNQVLALCGANVESLDSTAKRIIYSFPMEAWIDWAKKIDELTTLSNSYSEVMAEYILYYFPHIKNAPHYKDVGNRFGPALRCKILIKCLQYDDILKLAQITCEEWSKRKETKSKADAIILANPDAINELLINNPTLMHEDIVKLRKRIERIQTRYNVASSFDSWLPTQNNFNSLVSDIRNKCAKYCGYRTYHIKFQKPLSSGKTSTEEVRVRQVFPFCFSPYFVEYHSSLPFSWEDNILEFKARRIHYIESVYDRIIPYISALSTGKSILVVFNNNTSYKWALETYSYHYRYFKSVLNSNDISYIDMDNLHTIIDNFEYDIVIIFDFITVNTDLIYASKMFIESFSERIPNFMWYTMLKEYDEDEMKTLCADVIRQS